MEYTYQGGANNGHIAKLRDWVSGEEVSYTYDTLNRLITAAIDPGVSRATLVELLLLLGCFIPRLADRARQRLLGAGGPVFSAGPLSHKELRSRYQRMVDERMERQTLEEEVTNLRADSLCVCPINLREQ